MKPIESSVIRFIVVGVINTLVGTSIMFGFYNILGCSYWFSSMANYVITSILSFFLNKSYTFRNHDKIDVTAFKFIINIFVVYIVSYGIAKSLISWALDNKPEMIRDNVAMFLGMCLFVVFNYLGQRMFVFRRKF